MIRRGDTLDIPFLRSMLGHAYGWHVARFDNEIPLGRYVDVWGRPGDAALISMDEGHSVGAAWYRLFPTSAPGYGFVAAETSELALVVVPTRQGEGIGQELLDAILERAQTEGHPGLSVSVERGHEDIESYEERQFEQVGEAGNALTLLRSFS